MPLSRTTTDPLLSLTAALGLVAGVVAFAATLVLSPPDGLSLAGWHALGLALLMAIWWTTEPVPLGVTALMPLVVLPLVGIGKIGTVAAPYANPLVFLFLGGFLLAAGVRQWGLHKRLAHAVVLAIGTEPHRLVLGFMVASGFLSMWISNTAAIVLMLPVALSVVTALEDAEGKGEDVRRFIVALLLGLAFGASIGGVGTLIGTPPNALLAGYLLESHGIDVSFVAWSAVAMPMVIVFMPLAWLILTRVMFPVDPELAAAIRDSKLDERLAMSGPMTPAERRVGMVFLVAALLWMLRPVINRFVPGLENLSDPGIALTAGAALFFIPAGLGSERRFLLSWAEAKEIPWHVLILFGGGLSLAAAIDQSGLAQWIGQGLAALGDLPVFVFLLVLIAVVVVLTSFASNTATVAALLPVVGTIAADTGIDLITISAALAMAASCAFMMPVATPPNAIVFGTGHVTVWAMLRAGFVVNLLAIFLVAIAALALAPVLQALG